MGTNNEIRNTMISDIFLYKELEEEQVGGEFMEEKNFTRDKKKELMGKVLKAF